MINGLAHGGSRTDDADLADAFDTNRAHVFVYFVNPVRFQRADIGIGWHMIFREIVVSCAMMPIGRLPGAGVSVTVYLASDNR